MAWLIKLGSFLYEVVSFAMQNLASFTAIAVQYLYTILSTVLQGAWAIAAGTVSGLLEGFGFIGTDTALKIVGTASGMQVISDLIYTNISLGIHTASSLFKSFLEVIHYKTLIQIHQIAMLVSSDYRDMMAEVYKSIAKVSEALQVGSQFINLTLRNARNIVLDVSSMLGRRYDLGEVAWLTEMNKIFTAINAKALKLQINPYHLFEIIDSMVTEPALTTKASTMQNIFSGLDAVLTATDKFVAQISTLESDVSRFVHDLPDSINSNILPYINNLDNEVKSFKEDIYFPSIQKVSATLDILGSRIDKRKDEVDLVVGQLKKPGDLISHIENLGEDEREDQRSKMYVTVNKPLIESADVAGQVADTEVNHLESVVDALQSSEKPPEILSLEIEKPSKVNLGQNDQSNSWNVGEY